MRHTKRTGEGHCFPKSHYKPSAVAAGSINQPRADAGKCLPSDLRLDRERERARSGEKERERERGRGDNKEGEDD